MSGPSNNVQQDEIENIVNLFTEEQLAYLNNARHRIKQGVQDIDENLDTYISQLPTIQVQTTRPPEKWKTFNQMTLISLLQEFKLLQDPDNIPTKDEAIALLSRVVTQPASLEPLFLAQRRFKENMKRLDAIIRKLLMLMKEIPERTRTNALQKAIIQAETLQGETNSEKFYVLVFGELKAGKSTLLNFLLEDDVLPTDDTACTLVITELHYGETKKVITVDRHTSDKREEKIDFSQGKASEILKNFLSENSPDRKNPRFSKIILQWPSIILKAGIVFIDTPGLSEAATLDEIVDKYLEHTVGVICVLNSVADGGKVKTNLQRRLEKLTHKEGTEVAFICNRIDQVNDRGSILREIQKDIKIFFPRFRTECFLAFNARSAFFLKQAGFHTEEQAALISKLVQYLEISFRSRIRSLLEEVHTYSTVASPIIRSCKFDLQATCNSFNMSLQQRKQCASELSVIIQEKHKLFQEKKVFFNRTIDDTYLIYEGKYIKEFKDLDGLFLDYAMEQVDILESNEGHTALVSRLMSGFVNKAYKIHEIMTECVGKIQHALSTYSNTAKRELNSLEQKCLSTDPTHYLSHQFILTKDKPADLDDMVCNTLKIPLPIDYRQLSFPGYASRLWHIFDDSKSWRKKCAQEWIDNNLYKDLIPNLFVTPKGQAETVYKEIVTGVADRIQQMNQYITNLTRSSIFQIKELYVSLLAFVITIEEEAAKFWFDTVKTHLSDVTIKENLTAKNNVWYGKCDKDNAEVALTKITDVDATYYSRFLEQEENFKKFEDPNVLRYIGTTIVSNGNSSDRFIITEFCPSTLNQILQSPNMTPQHAVTILVGIAQGISYIHSKNFMHMKLQTEHILVAPPLTPKISVLNLCTDKTLSYCTSKPKKGYIAPELYMGNRCTAKVDVFEFGKLIKEVCRDVTMPMPLITLAAECDNHSPVQRPNCQIIIERLSTSYSAHSPVSPPLTASSISPSDALFRSSSSLCHANVKSHLSPPQLPHPSPPRPTHSSPQLFHPSPRLSQPLPFKSPIPLLLNSQLSHVTTTPPVPVNLENKTNSDSTPVPLETLNPVPRSVPVPSLEESNKTSKSSPVPKPKTSKLASKKASAKSTTKPAPKTPAKKSAAKPVTTSTSSTSTTTTTTTSVTTRKEDEGAKGKKTIE